MRSLRSNDAMERWASNRCQGQLPEGCQARCRNPGFLQVIVVGSNPWDKGRLPTGAKAQLNMTGSLGLKSPIYMIGSKSILADWIISHFPKHHCYCEAFAGSAKVLLAKEPSKVEVLNDINGDVVNFFQVLRDRTSELAAKAAFTPHSRQVYEVWLEEWRHDGPPEDPLEKAYRWFYLQTESFGGKLYSGWGHNAVGSSTARRWVMAVGRLVDAAERLQQVAIECMDFRDIIKTYDTPDTLFYLDPPYVDAPEDYYGGHVMTWADHLSLGTLLNQIQGKACLSYYDGPIIQKCYGHWKKEAVKIPVFSQGVTHTAPTKERKQATELLLMNY